MKTNHILVEANSTCFAHKLGYKKVDLIVTSPPYYNLKDYGVKNQTGFGQRYARYIMDLNHCWKDCDDLLKPGCRICINIGDVYQSAKKHGKYEILPVPAEIIHYFKNVLEYDYFGSIVWQKVSTFNSSGGASVIGSYPYPRNGMVKYDYEYILIFRKPGKQPKVSKEIKEKSKMTKEEWKKFFYGHWNIPGKKQDKHKAQFPLEIPERLIKMFSFVGDTVLDPYTGGGTTNIAALKNDRNSIGIDLNVDFLTDALDCLIDYKSVNNKDANTSLIRKSYFDTFKEVKV